MRKAVVWSAVWLAVGIGFTAVMWLWQGSESGSEYLAGYILERSLSLDNVFVFAVIFSYFAVDPKDQPRVLAWGIAVALLLRAVFILLGAALLDTFHATFYVFGALLVYTAWKLARHSDAEVQPDRNPVVRWLQRRGASPLVVVFAAIAITDVIFAVDSVPAIFAVTQDALVVFAANAFAMLGLRSLYFVLVGLMDRFAYLSYGLSVVLAFIGAKMLLIDVWHPPIWLSLTVIATVLAATMVVSARLTRERAPA
jgi:tellurite resistance protein TerC